MSRVNNCNFLVDFTGNKFFDELNVKDRRVPFARFIGYVPDAEDTRPVNKLRFVAYGHRAELAYAYIQAGTRAFLFCHLQQREERKSIILEFVITDIQFIKGENEEEGRKKYLELVERGVLRPSYRDFSSGDGFSDPDDESSYAVKNESGADPQQPTQGTLNAQQI